MCTSGHSTAITIYHSFCVAQQLAQRVPATSGSAVTSGQDDRRVAVRGLLHQPPAHSRPERSELDTWARRSHLSHYASPASLPPAGSTALRMLPASGDSVWRAAARIAHMDERLIDFGSRQARCRGRDANARPVDGGIGR